ncbi:unnamed protein product [Cuscuta campestris]|uniref:Pectinesterase inhibitor domain-containing protein n=1 Tax=Cuscuta campestris TaxID=132261 RepID=A0A484NL90_9ASTE|nr:unnamed protein product [Cuscuta campestris]
MAVLGVCSLILVAMVVALTIGSQDSEPENSGQDGITASRKAIQAVCQPTTYKETCVKSLFASNATQSTDPRDLIQVAFNVTIKDIRDSIKNSSLFLNLKDDPRSKAALENCEDLANQAIEDLRRTLAKFKDFNLLNLDNWLDDLKTWLSGSLTYQETCLSGFQEIPGNEEKRMRELLTKSMQMTSNALAMVKEISSLITEDEAESLTNEMSRRRLLSSNKEKFPEWVTPGRRGLLAANLSKVKPNLIVAKDGSGNYMSINDALKNIPTKSDETFVLYIKEGVYEEQVTVYRNITHLTMIGDGSNKTRITGWLNFIDGISTFHTATVGEY